MLARFEGPAKVVALRRGLVTIEFAEGATAAIPTVSEDEEQAWASVFGEQGRAALVFYGPGETEKTALSEANARADQAEAEVTRLKALVAALEESKGVRAVRLEAPGNRFVLTAPGLDERKAALLMSAIYAGLLIRGQLLTMGAAEGVDDDGVGDLLRKLDSEIYRPGQTTPGAAEPT